MSPMTTTSPNLKNSAVGRTCLDCQASSLIVPFYRRKTGRLSSRCIECEKSSSQSRYESRKKIQHQGPLCACGCGKNASPGKNFINGHARRKSGVDYLVEDRGYRTPCWIWQLATDEDGYGTLKASQTTRAHIFYYERRFGPVPAGHVSDHLCRVPSCVNPDHIEPVTVAVNTRRGLSAKLNEGKVKQIRSALDSGVTQVALAARFGVTPATISAIRIGRNWKGVFA